MASGRGFIESVDAGNFHLEIGVRSWRGVSSAARLNAFVVAIHHRHQLPEQISFMPVVILQNGAQSGFEPLTHALRIRGPLARAISINILDVPSVVYVHETPGKTACAGTKVATLAIVQTRLHGTTSLTSLLDAGLCPILSG